MMTENKTQTIDAGNPVMEARRMGFRSVRMCEEYATSWMWLTDEPKLPQGFRYDRDFQKLYASIEESNPRILREHLVEVLKV